jgi:TonB-dependent starch-binding outer membrane protein SusC
MIKQYIKKALLLQFFLLLSCILFAQQKTVTGKVTDEDGKPIAAVTVGVKGTTTNTATDQDGAYSIVVPSNQAVLKFSNVGMLYEEKSVGTKTTISVSMQKDTKQLDDVVVVGYGTKKRVNLVGAVASIKPEEIEDLPVANLGTALVNRVPGLSVNVASGKPGATTTLTIRNPTLFAASGRLGLTNDPLYIIDGLTMTKQDFDNLDASLVESISFLKDASAAVYGASGAKGVILVTTKKGKPGKARISYSGYYGSTTATVGTKVLSAYDHAKMLNDGYVAANQPDNLKFSQTDLDFLATNPYKSWYQEMWKPAHLMRHTLNVSGGTEKITFFAGGNYYDESGNFGDISIKKYGIRSGMNAKITETVSASISLNTDYTTSNRNTLKGSSTETEDLMIRALMLTPQWVPLTVNGLPNNWSNSPNAPGPWNPIALFNSGDYEKNNSQGLNLNANIEYKPLFLKGLTAKVQFGKNNRSGTSKQYFPSYTVYNFNRSGPSGTIYTDVPTGTTSKITNTDRLQEGTSFNNSYQLIGSLDYARKIKKHDFDVLVLAEQTEGQGNSYLTYRDGQQVPNVDQLFAFNAATTTVQLNGASESGKRSYLGRLNYAFDNKYLLEFVGRYDGSANFPSDKRWGFFHSIGFGWKVSEEPFFKNHIKFINSLKLRANFGLIGDDRVSGYQFVSRFTQTTGALFGTTVTNGLDPNIFPNPEITWEKARTRNLGLDASFLKNKLTFSMDIWHRHTYDGFDDLVSVSLPFTVGISAGLKNYGIQNNWGTEFSIGYRGSINKDWKFNVDANFGTSDNQLIQTYYSPSKLGGATEYADILTGKSSSKYSSSNYGYISKGILRTQNEVDAILAKNPNYKINGVKPQPGFLDYEDVNNDGIIDGNDIVPMYENIASKFGVGLTIGIAYKAFKLNTNISLSVGGKKFYDTEARKVPTTNQSAPDFWKDHWTPENPDAKYPRADAPLAKENSTFWAVNGTVARVNNMVLSYTMPKRISAKLRIPEFKLSIAGTNLWNIINPYKYKDPSTGNFASYPTLRTISVGLNITL